MELKRKRDTLTELSKETLTAYGRAWLEEARDRLKRTTWHGYSDTFTMDVYSDSLPDMQEAVAETWDSLLGERAEAGR